MVAFVPALPLRASAAHGAAVRRAPAPVRALTPRMSIAEVDVYYPFEKRHEAPFISFDGENGVKLEMKRVAAFAEVDDDAGSLFDYDVDRFISNKPAPSPGAGWSSGDGRRVPMKGTTGSFTQPNLRQYGPFPDFLKRSCDL
ncbi:hypothetical protein I4F81_001160 [Pyropia yezoensis]|uniref:Uncharacterized protein n=1 Tax=Pyropia yezoensis TaxID=2788 RepID=A0ACC3BKR5_PYRYE|nr:hypothetical protein I4F81_001160 [Neopyropia yezoensis]